MQRARHRATTVTALAHEHRDVAAGRHPAAGPSSTTPTRRHELADAQQTSTPSAPASQLLPWATRSSRPPRDLPATSSRWRLLRLSTQHPVPPRWSTSPPRSSSCRRPVPVPCAAGPNPAPIPDARRRGRHRRPLPLSRPADRRTPAPADHGLACPSGPTCIARSRPSRSPSASRSRRASCVTTFTASISPGQLRRPLRADALRDVSGCSRLRSESWRSSPSAASLHRAQAPARGRLDSRVHRPASDTEVAVSFATSSAAYATRPAPGGATADATRSSALDRSSTSAPRPGSAAVSRRRPRPLNRSSPLRRGAQGRGANRRAHAASTRPRYPRRRDDTIAQLITDYSPSPIRSRATTGAPVATTRAAPPALPDNPRCRQRPGESAAQRGLAQVLARTPGLGTTVATAPSSPPERRTRQLEER